jgi:D-alanyl-D-alanine carboxypeptidase (penicillin-binding protein 5/6)
VKRFHWGIVLFLVFMGLFFLSRDVSAAPWISARAYCVYDLKTGQLLDGKNVRTPLPPASTTKIMTALLALEYLDLEEKALISERAAQTPPTAIGLRTGQEMKVRDLLVAALLSSANDATVVLAERIAGSEELFAYLMNKKAFVLGAAVTDFKNSNGLPATGHLSSCHDLFIISRAALQNPFFAETVAKAEESIAHPGYPQGKLIKNTNRLLTTYPGTKGIKTGTTDAAGKCLVGLAEKDNRQLITVVLRAGDRYRDSTTLFDYGFTAFYPTRVIDSQDTYKFLRIDNGDAAKVALYPERDITVLLPEDGLKNLEKRTVLTYRPQAPVKKGDRIGTLEVYYKGELVDKVGLRSGATVEKLPSGIWKILRRALNARQMESQPGTSSGSCCGS